MHQELFLQATVVKHYVQHQSCSRWHLNVIDSKLVGSVTVQTFESERLATMLSKIYLLKPTPDISIQCLAFSLHTGNV